MKKSKDPDYHVRALTLDNGLFPDSQMKNRALIASHYSSDAAAVLYHGDRLDLLKEIPNSSAQLVVTSPPYNIGKEYERVRDLDEYLRDQEATIEESVRILADNGSLCWQVGNHIRPGSEIVPLDIKIYPMCERLGLKLRNRIIWHFGHGLHCTKRFSGRYETILWFTKSDKYIFNLDTVRVPQKYPGKRNYNGPKRGKLSCNPLGKNPSDIWEIPNVKSNHIEKTDHPCQFPIELIERLVLALTEVDGLVVDPYVGVGSAICAAILHKRRGAGSDISNEYLSIAQERVLLALEGRLPTRPMGKPIYDASQSRLSIRPEQLSQTKFKLVTEAPAKQ